MSVLDEPDPPAAKTPVEVSMLRPLVTRADRREFGERSCDACATKQPKGCAVMVRLGWKYAELCATCFEALKEAVKE